MPHSLWCNHPRGVRERDELPHCAAHSQTAFGLNIANGIIMVTVINCDSAPFTNHIQLLKPAALSPMCSKKQSHASILTTQPSYLCRQAGTNSGMTKISSSQYFAHQKIQRRMSAVNQNNFSQATVHEY